MLLSYWYLCWINFWRLPETAETRRCQSKAYQNKARVLKDVWSIALLILAVSGQVVLIIFGVTLLTFVSLMILDDV